MEKSGRERTVRCEETWCKKRTSAFPLYDRPESTLSRLSHQPPLRFQGQLWSVR